MGGGGFADGGAERGLDHNVFVVGADLLENLGGAVGIEVVNERGIQTHHEAFAGRDAGRFLERLGLNRHFVFGLERVDEMDALTQSLAGNSSEQGENADVTGANSSHGTE